MPRVSGVLTWAWGGEGGVPQFSGEQTRSGPYLRPTPNVSACRMIFRSPDGHAAVVVEALAVGEPAAPRAVGPEVAGVTPDK